MKLSLLAFIVLTFAGAAFAQDTQVCFERVYSAAHMKQNPKQLVKAIRVTLTQEDHLYNAVDVETRKPIKGTKMFSSGGACQLGGGNILNCGLDADGGGYTLTQNGKTAMLKVSSALFLYRNNVESEDESEGRDLVLSAGATNGVYKLNSVPCK